MSCDMDTLSRDRLVPGVHTSIQFLLTMSAVCIFIGTKFILDRIKRELAQLTVIVVGAGPIGITSALIAVQCRKVTKLIVYEEQSRFALENKSYQIALQSSMVLFLKKFGVDFDNLEGCWNHGCFYTRVGIYVEYVLNILHSYDTEVIIKLNTKFTRETSAEIDDLPGRVLVICCDGSNGQAARALGISDECVQHSCGIYGAVAAIERSHSTLVPTPSPEKRIHNLTFDLAAYGACVYEENGHSNFSLKIFGNSKHKYIALAVVKSESSVVKALKTILDKSMMRNLFLKCYNTYKQDDEPSISDSFALNNMKFSPRLCDIKLFQRMESVSYFSDCDLFVITEGEASRSYNFNTGMDVNVGLKGLTSLQSFINMVVDAQTEHTIVDALVYKMNHSDKICKDFLKYGPREYMFL